MLINEPYDLSIEPHIPTKVCDISVGVHMW